MAHDSHQFIQTLDATTSVDQTLYKISHVEDSQNADSTNTEGLSTLSVASKKFPIEQVDWVKINDKLRKNGFQPIMLLHPETVTSYDGCVVLSENSSKYLQKLLITLMAQQQSNQSYEQQSSGISCSESLPTAAASTDFVSRNDQIDNTQRKIEDSKLREKDNIYDMRLNAIEKEVNDLKEIVLKQNGEAKIIDNKNQPATTNMDAVENEILRLKLKKSKKKVARLKSQIEEMRTLERKEIERKNEIGIVDINPIRKASNRTYDVVDRNAKSTSPEDFIGTTPKKKSYRTNVQEAFQSLNYLQKLILPSTEMDLCSTTHIHTVHQLKSIIDKLASMYINRHLLTSEDPIDDDNVKTPYKMLVEHFMHLFDVKRTSEVYTSIYDVYMKFYEDKNTLHSIREILQLASSLPNVRLVEIIGKLSKAKHLLKVKDVEKVIKQVEKYDIFYVKFHALVNGIMRLLAVDSIDHILPSLKVLLNVARE